MQYAFVPVTFRTTFPYGYLRKHAISFCSTNQYVENQLRSLLHSLPMSAEKPKAESHNAIKTQGDETRRTAARKYRQAHAKIVC